MYWVFYMAQALSEAQREVNSNNPGQKRKADV